MTNFDLAVTLASMLTTTSPPGRTAFSVEVAPDCAPATEACEGAKRSSFYGAWVRRESEAAGSARLVIAAEELARAARDELCVGPAGEATCKRTSAQKRFTLLGLTALGAAIATYESGWREDVAVGRGRARDCPENGPKSIPGKCGPSDDGGRGRGPGGERCYMQIHPSVRDDDRLLGTDREALYACFRQGLSMLVHARNYCARVAPEADQTWATVALYGSGADCYSTNHGKTRPRVELARKFYFQLRQAERKAR